MGKTAQAVQYEILIVTSMAGTLKRKAICKTAAKADEIEEDLFDQGFKTVRRPYRPEDDKKAKHTPGPWRVATNDETRAGVKVYDSENVEVVSMMGWDAELSAEKSRARGEANARLIASAPQLLAFAKQVAMIYEGEQADYSTKWPDGKTEGSIPHKIGQAARAAIAKAEGAI